MILLGTHCLIHCPDRSIYCFLLLLLLGLRFHGQIWNREVVKKEQELVEWQLKEKETKAQLQDVEENLKRAHFVQASQQLEPKKLLTLLPALREWLRSLKKVCWLPTLSEAFQEGCEAPDSIMNLHRKHRASNTPHVNPFLMHWSWPARAIPTPSATCDFWFPNLVLTFPSGWSTWV